ncbi:MAG TPA: SUMF1/EgtB/PvdO family nonheme iron enzyme [Burkholderiaceae bacterium]|nr:SUMF1/EgtB/PvdO family nonheme iron enzyme [Burkholderiaceae bacterium]
MDSVPRARFAASLRSEWRAASAHTDALFALVDTPTLYDRPIPDRHRLIFYVGHLDAFDWNQLARGVLDLPSFHPSFDRLFEAGIDPPPGQAPADRKSDWPGLDEVRAYVARTRRLLEENWSELPIDRVLTALEHRWMHAETLCYLLHELDPALKHAPAAPGEAPAPSVAPAHDPWAAIPPGDATLGQDPGEFGWDNEFPQHKVTVGAFNLARHKLTNGEYLRLVTEGGATPHFWRRRDGAWRLRRMFDEIPLPLDAPAYLTQQQAVAYATWAGVRLPTEAEWQLAAYGAEARPYPWGEVAPDATRANLDFAAWDPWPVTAHPNSATQQGIEQMVGNGWEWTATPFAGFDGFAPRAYYPGYSANFFDDAHYVMKGASPRTARRLVRPSFRNWFRAEYPYAYATVRLARD